MQCVTYGIHCFTELLNSVLRSVNKIPWAKPTIFGNEKDYVENAIGSTWLSDGHYVDKFESDIANLVGCKHGISVSNGTAALDLGFRALGITAGDEVVLPGFGFMAAANVALQYGAVPKFAEVNKHTWCVDVAALERCITKRTKALVAIHTYGNVCEMDEIVNLAEEKKISVIEDGSEAFGSTYKGVHVGSFGHLSTFSFQATKTITTGEGGMVLTNDTELDRMMRLHRNHGMLRKKHYWHEIPGHNYRITNLQAAFGCAQLVNLADIKRERKRIHHAYKVNLSNLPNCIPQHFDPSVDPMLWTFAIKLHDLPPGSRDSVLQILKNKGIETRPGFYTPYQMDHIYKSELLPNCEDVSQNVLSLPTYISLSNDEITWICEELKCSILELKDKRAGSM